MWAYAGEVQLNNDLSLSLCQSTTNNSQGDVQLLVTCRIWVNHIPNLWKLHNIIHIHKSGMLHWQYYAEYSSHLVIPHIQYYGSE